MWSLNRMLTVFAALVPLAAISFAEPAQAERRVALVIGNSVYKKVGVLENAARDAAAIAALFKSAGFQVVELRRDLGIAGLRRAVSDFAETVSDADVAVVFFAGHGIEVDGTNYLIPIDAQLARDFDVEDETLSLDRVLKAIEPAKRLRLVILDACRDNPFFLSMRRSTRSIGRGLARVDPTTADTLIAFAAKAGSTAADGVGANSPFTAALLKHLTHPGLDIRLALGRVRDEVMANTGRRQEPFVYGSLGGQTISILDPLPTSAQSETVRPGVRIDSCAAAETHWKSVDSIGTREAYQDHLARFQNCAFAGLARTKVDVLAKAVVVVPPPMRPSITPLSCSDEPSAKSIDGNRPTSMLFVNNRNAAVRVYWLDYQGQRKFYNELHPGQQYVQTFMTQPWIITDTFERCFAIYMPEPTQRRVDIR